MVIMDALSFGFFVGFVLSIRETLYIIFGCVFLWARGGDAVVNRVHCVKQKESDRSVIYGQRSVTIDHAW